MQNDNNQSAKNNNNNKPKWSYHKKKSYNGEQPKRETNPNSNTRGNHRSENVGRGASPQGGRQSNANPSSTAYRARIRKAEERRLATSIESLTTESDQRTLPDLASIGHTTTTSSVPPSPIEATIADRNNAGPLVDVSELTHAEVVGPFVSAPSVIAVPVPVGTLNPPHPTVLDTGALPVPVPVPERIATPAFVAPSSVSVIMDALMPVSYGGLTAPGAPAPRRGDIATPITVVDATERDISDMVRRVKNFDVQLHVWPTWRRIVWSFVAFMVFMTIVYHGGKFFSPLTDFIVGALGMLCVVVFILHSCVYERYVYYGEYLLDHSRDERQDLVALGTLKHQDPRYAYIRYTKWTLANAFNIDFRTDIMLVSMEMLIQLLAPENLTMLSDDATVASRMTFTATHMHSVNISKEVYLENHYVATNTTILAFGMYREMRMRRAVHYFPVPRSV